MKYYPLFVILAIKNTSPSISYNTASKIAILHISPPPPKNIILYLFTYKNIEYCFVPFIKKFWDTSVKNSLLQITRQMAVSRINIFAK